MSTKIKTTYKCPSCGISHEIQLDEDEDEEDYDGLCPKCEVEWVNSEEYKDLLQSLD